LNWYRWGSRKRFWYYDFLLHKIHWLWCHISGGNGIDWRTPQQKNILIFSLQQRNEFRLFSVRNLLFLLFILQSHRLIFVSFETRSTSESRLRHSSTSYMPISSEFPHFLYVRCCGSSIYVLFYCTFFQILHIIIGNLKYYLHPQTKDQNLLSCLFALHHFQRKTISITDGAEVTDNDWKAHQDSSLRSFASSSLISIWFTCTGKFLTSFLRFRMQW